MGLLRFLHWWRRGDPVGAERGAELPRHIWHWLHQTSSAKPGLFYFCWAESGISLSGEGAENDTVGKSLLGNLIQEQHKCGICLWPITVRTAQGSKAGSQNFSPLHLFPSTHQRLLKACVTQDCVKRSILGSAFHWGLPLPPGHEVKKRATKTQK